MRFRGRPLSRATVRHGDQDQGSVSLARLTQHWAGAVDMDHQGTCFWSCLPRTARPIGSLGPNLTIVAVAMVTGGQ